MFRLASLLLLLISPVLLKPHFCDRLLQNYSKHTIICYLQILHLLFTNWTSSHHIRGLHTVDVQLSIPQVTLTWTLSVFYIPLMFIVPGMGTIVRLEKFQENSIGFVSDYQSHLHFHWFLCFWWFILLIFTKFVSNQSYQDFLVERKFIYCPHRAVLDIV